MSDYASLAAQLRKADDAIRYPELHSRAAAALEEMAWLEKQMLSVIQEAHRFGFRAGMGPCVCKFCRAQEKEANG